MNAEDTSLAYEEKSKKRERQKNAWHDKGWKTTKLGDRQEDRCSKPPTGRFSNFTLLAALIDKVLMQIKDDTA